MLEIINKNEVMSLPLLCLKDCFEFQINFFTKGELLNDCSKGN